MNRLIAILVIAARLLAPGHASGQSGPPSTETLHNQSVVDMVSAKLSKSLIVQKIKTTPARFDVSSSALVALNSAKVPNDLIKLMMDLPCGSLTPSPATPEVPKHQADLAPSPARETAPQASPGPSPSAPAVRVPKAPLRVPPSEPGIHLRSTGAQLELLEPNTYSGASNAGHMGATLSLGISKAKIKAHILSPSAAIRTSDASAEFYFVFSVADPATSWSKGLRSPNQYALVRLDRKSDHRELTLAASGTGGMQTGVDDKSAVSVRITRMKPGVYLVVPVTPLEPGEYAFIPLGGAGGDSDLYDFGIDQP